MQTNDPQQPYNQNGRTYDTVEFRKDGTRRKKFGRWLHKAYPVVGKVIAGAAWGIIDGIPMVSQVASTLTAGKPVNGFDKGTRVIVGWATVGMVGMTFLMKLTGSIDGFTMLAILRMFIGM